MDQGADAYEKGNAAFRSGDTENALKLYEYGCAVCNNDELLVKLFMNCSQCNMMLRNYDVSCRIICYNPLTIFQAAESLCSKALVLDPHNIKALLRRAIARESMGEYQKSLEDIEAAKNIQPRNAYEGEILKLRSRIVHAIRLDSAALRKDSRPELFVSSHQTLRLNFGDIIPLTLLQGQKYFIKLNVTNEFGLWQRAAISELSQSPLLSVRCEVHRTWGATSQVVVETTGGFLGPDGRADLVIMFPEMMESTRPIFVMLSFSLSEKLPSGHLVLTLYSLPLLLRSSGRHNQDSLESGSEDPTLALPRQLCEVAHAILSSSIRATALPTPEPIDHTRTSIPAVNAVYVLECPGNLGIGGKVWDATFSLLDFLELNPEIIHNKVVVELGSGTGLAGLALGALHPQAVILTDMPEVYPLLAANILLNRAVSSADGMMVSASGLDYRRFSAAPQFWGTPLHEDIVSNVEMVPTDATVVVAADVVYDPIGYAPLVQTIQDLLLPNSERSSAFANCMILAQRHRNPEDYKFFDMIRAPSSKLAIEEIESGAVNQGVALQKHKEVQAKDSGGALQDIKIFRIVAASPVVPKTMT